MPSLPTAIAEQDTGVYCLSVHLLTKDATMTLVKCEVSEGVRSDFKTVGVLSVIGHREYISIEERFLVKYDGGYVLPVEIIGQDTRYDNLLLQLPFEADSGANRVWVRSADVITQPSEIPA
jgi:hypothetical protein